VIEPRVYVLGHGVITLAEYHEYIFEEWRGMEPDFYVGLDLGQSKDYTALAVVEQPLWVPAAAALDLATAGQGWVSPADLTAYQRDGAREHWRDRPGRPTLAVRHLQRWPLGTSYPDIARDVARLLAAPPLYGAGVTLIVDATGVGPPVVDLIREQGVAPIAATITSGMQTSLDGPSVHVPKRDLVSTMAVLLEGRRLKIAEALPEAPTLTRELGEFQRRVTPAGHDQYASWRESTHDDLVLAVALACWWREWYFAHYDAAVAERRGTIPSRGV